MMKHHYLSTRKIASGLAIAVALGIAGTAEATKYEFHGDLDNRFLLGTDQSTFATNGIIAQRSQNERFGEFKYRLWSTAATDDGATKGVYAIEVGGKRFGQAGGGSFSGDGVNVETRWAYVDTDIGGPGRLKIGLQPYSLNKHLWNETAAGITLNGGRGGTKYTIAWIRGSESFNDERSVSDDLDAYSAKFNWSPSKNVKIGVFGLVQMSDDKDALTSIDCEGGPGNNNRSAARCYEVKNFATGGAADFSLTSFGIDGGWTNPTRSGNFFVNWDVIVQEGDIDNVDFSDTNGDGLPIGDFDISGQMFRFEVGGKAGKFNWKYTLLNQSGDDDPLDRDLDAFLATDMDSFGSPILNESITSDTFLVETHYLFDKGTFQNRFNVGYQINKNVWLGGAVSLLALDEDVTYNDVNGIPRSDDALGTEISAHLKYKFATNTAFELQAAFLSADDAMDFFETGVDRDGSSDQDIYKVNARVRYKF